MDRQAEALSLAGQLLEDIELVRMPIGQLILKATRLARIIEDEATLVWLGYEARGCPSTDDGKQHMTRTGRWTDREKGEGYWAPVAALQACIDGDRQTVDALKVESVGGQYASIALREQRSSIIQLAHEAQAISQVVPRVLGLVHEFATRVYLELQFSDAQAEMFETARQDVDARLALLSGEALIKIATINDRFRAGDKEAISHAMTTARRLIDSVADSIFPGRPDLYIIGDESMIVDDSKILNRVNAFLHQSGATDGRRKRIRRMVGDIYERVSKGVHDDVSIEEARFVFLQTYVVLGEIVSFVPRIIP